MLSSILFCAGLGLGFTLGLATWAFCFFLGKKVAEIDLQKRNAKAFAEMQATKAKRDELLAKFRAGNPEMSEREEAMLNEELSTVFQGRQRR